MKEKSNATLRRAASLRCRTDAAIARLGKAVACYQRGAITTAELLRGSIRRGGPGRHSGTERGRTGRNGQLRPLGEPQGEGVPRTTPAPPPASPWVIKSDADCRRQALDLCPNGGAAWKSADGPHRPRPALGRCRRSAQRGRVRRLRGLRDALKYPRLTMARWPRAETPRASREARNIFEIREASP